MNQRRNEFADIEANSCGIFGADMPGLRPTLAEHDSVRGRVVREGIEFTYTCDGCGCETQFICEWPELVAMKYGLNPVAVFQRHPNLIGGQPLNWSYDQDDGGWKPHMKCRAKCREFHCGLRLSADEPEAYLKKGRRARFINPQGEQTVNQVCAHFANAATGGR